MQNVFIDPAFETLYARFPLVLADAGARGGLRRKWLPARKFLHVLGFEPEAREFERLAAALREQGSADRVFRVALHNRRGTIALHVARDGGLSSLFPPNRTFLDAFPESERFDIVGRQEIDADTLDNVLGAHGIEDLDFIKADTQGSELFILQGATRALERSVVGVEVEVEFSPIYDGQPLFADVDRFLRERGFQLFDLRPCYWKRAAAPLAGGPYGQVIWADALYLKSLPDLMAMTRPLPAEARKAKLLKTISVAVLYGYLDFAIEIARAPDAELTAAERRLTETRLTENTAPRGALPGQDRMTGALRRLVKVTEKPYEGWSVSDPDLGNPD